MKGIRKDYNLNTLNKKDLVYSPINQFNIWFHEIVDFLDEPNAMILSTSDNSGRVQSRVVLLKSVKKAGFVFFTNYNSVKSKHISKNQNVSLCFFWPKFEKQVRVNGLACKVSVRDSKVYFSTRPRRSQIAAWVSDQSSCVKDRSVLESKFNFFEKKFENRLVPKPDYWGGYVVKPLSVEFWQGRSGRLHDRFLYTKKNKRWVIHRLCP